MLSKILNTPFQNILIIQHSKGAPGLRYFGIGPSGMPCRGLLQLKSLLDKNAPWAKNRSIKNLKRMLKNSDVIISAWIGSNLIGFSRATSDTIFRATIWDVVVDSKFRKCGVGKMLVNKTLNHKALTEVEKIYLMTTMQVEFYKKCGFSIVKTNKLMIMNF